MDIFDTILNGTVSNPMVILIVWPAIALICQAVAKAIPDTARGFWGVVRKISKVVGLYVANKTGREGF